THAPHHVLSHIRLFLSRSAFKSRQPAARASVVSFKVDGLTDPVSPVSDTPRIQSAYDPSTSQTGGGGNLKLPHGIGQQRQYCSTNTLGSRSGDSMDPFSGPNAGIHLCNAIKLIPDVDTTQVIQFLPVLLNQLIECLIVTGWLAERWAQEQSPPALSQATTSGFGLDVEEVGESQLGYRLANPSAKRPPIKPSDVFAVQTSSFGSTVLTSGVEYPNSGVSTTQAWLRAISRQLAGPGGPGDVTKIVCGLIKLAIHPEPISFYQLIRFGPPIRIASWSLPVGISLQALFLKGLDARTLPPRRVERQDRDSQARRSQALPSRVVSVIESVLHEQTVDAYLYLLIRPPSSLTARSPKLYGFIRNGHHSLTTSPTFFIAIPFPPISGRSLIQASPFAGLAVSLFSPIYSLACFIIFLRSHFVSLFFTQFIFPLIPVIFRNLAFLPFLCAYASECRVMAMLISELVCQHCSRNLQYQTLLLEPAYPSSPCLCFPLPSSAVSTASVGTTTPYTQFTNSGSSVASGQLRQFSLHRNYLPSSGPVSSASYSDDGGKSGDICPCVLLGHTATTGCRASLLKSFLEVCV
ncbi:unnamed protein product, partial [Protopolystoma xenopodis]